MKVSGWNVVTILTLFSLILYSILVGCRKKSEEPMKIEPGVGIGKVKFGMRSKEVRNILGKPDFEMRGAQTTECLVYNKLGLNISIFKDGVDTITCIGVSGDPDVKPCTARTSRDIGIGSTREQIIEAYGEPTSDERNIIKYGSIRTTFMVSEDGVTETMLFKQVE